MFHLVEKIMKKYFSTENTASGKFLETNHYKLSDISCALKVSIRMISPKKEKAKEIKIVKFRC